MKKTKKNMVIRLVISLVVLIVSVGMGILTGLIDSEEIFGFIRLDLTKLFQLIILIFGIVSVESVLNLILSSFHPKNHRLRSVLTLVSSLMRYAAFIIILCFGLAVLGVNISTIVASVGILALIIGFSAESLIADIVTGIFMIFENQYNVGDIVEIDGFRGTVSDIGIRTTCITDTGDNVKIINNSAVKNVLNRSDKLSRSVSEIGIPYSTDLEKLEEKLPKFLNDMYENRKEIFKSAPVYLGVSALADSAVVLKFVVAVAEKDIYSGGRILNRDLFVGFRKLGVEVPFPQVDVHMDK